MDASFIDPYPEICPSSMHSQAFSKTGMVANALPLKGAAG
jgi:hypothetical protein